MDLLDRFYARFREAAAARLAEGTPLKVADVYQHLLPYRAVRGELGILELAEYEHLLLRLLSGEREYLQVADPEVRVELRRELGSTNPILGIYRDYSEVEVQVLDGAPAPDAAPAHAEAAPAESAPPPPLPDAPPPAPPAPPVENCRACRAPLPDVEGLRFCPACGVDQHETPCPECGTPVRPGWNFCVRCGRARAAQASRE